jgi:hypothetical protein
MVATITSVTVTTYAGNRHAIQFPVNSNIQKHTNETIYLNHITILTHEYSFCCSNLGYIKVLQNKEWKKST